MRLKKHFRDNGHFECQKNDFNLDQNMVITLFS